MTLDPSLCEVLLMPDFVTVADDLSALAVGFRALHKQACPQETRSA